MPTMYINCEVPTEISEEDFDVLNGFEFSLTSDGRYLQCTSPKQYDKRRLHDIVGEWMGLIGPEIDHKDTNGFNNERTNLRSATRNQNAANSKLSKANTTGYKGVTFSKRHNKYMAKITVNYKTIHLGYFNDPEIAYNSYCNAAIKYFGQFANFGD